MLNQALLYIPYLIESSHYAPAIKYVNVYLKGYIQSPLNTMSLVDLNSPLLMSLIKGLEVQPRSPTVTLQTV